jgi:hypothetical protein
MVKPLREEDYPILADTWRDDAMSKDEEIQQLRERCARLEGKLDVYREMANKRPLVATPFVPTHAEVTIPQAHLSPASPPWWPQTWGGWSRQKLNAGLAEFAE